MQNHLPLALALAAALPLAAASDPGAPAPRAVVQDASRSDPVLPSAMEETTVVVTEEQVRAVERGLKWLAANQEPDGSWTGDIGFKLNTGYSVTADSKGHVGVTALACMAFLAGGHMPGRGEYGPVVERGLEFVLACVQDDGYVTRSGSRMYSHAFAALFLAEVYGMTHRPEVREKLQKAVDFIVHSQNHEGAWRYEPYAAESDMSIVVCQVIALRSARNIGIRVPKSVVDRAARYVVDSAVTEDSLTRVYLGPMANYREEIGSFHYQKQDGSRSSFSLTAAGVTALHGLGIYSDEAIDQGVSYLQRNLRNFNARYGYSSGGHYFFWYGHYYGVQAMYTAGGAAWESYFPQVRDEILRMQEPSGSFPNRVGPGSAFGTAMAVLILEIPFRFLPIFQR